MSSKLSQKKALDFFRQEFSKLIYFKIDNFGVQPLLSEPTKIIFAPSKNQNK